MRTIGIILGLTMLLSCYNKQDKKGSTSNNRLEILSRNFLDAEVISIDIIEIEHPMLGGIIKTIKLTNNQQIEFLNNFDKLKKKGMFKCGAKYVLRLNFAADTLRLKACGNKIANRNSDLYYELENGENIIDKYITKK